LSPERDRREGRERYGHHSETCESVLHVLPCGE